MSQPPDTPTGPRAIQAPWRQEYLNLLDAREKPAAPETPTPSTGSFLRDYWLAPDRDEANHVLVRTGVGMILLNAFPYAAGHLLVALGDARPRLLDYDPPARAAFWTLVERAWDLMQRTFSPQGINMGVNEGRAAGAGIPHHVHAHLVPRWGGDVNFMAVVGQVRVIPASLDAVSARYRATLAADG